MDSRPSRSPIGSPIDLLRFLGLGLALMSLLGCSDSAGLTSSTPTSSNRPARPASAATAQGEAENSAAAVLNAHKAEFATALDAGKDPFFPNSPRRKPQEPRVQPVVAAAPRPKPPPAAAEFLKLNGLWPSKRRPLAMINRSIFAAGERGEVTYSAPGTNQSEIQVIKVQVVEIKEDSVVIQIDGEPGVRELRLSTGP